MTSVDNLRPFIFNESVYNDSMRYITKELAILMDTPSNVVEIRGQKDGLWVYFDDQSEIADIFDALEQKLASSNNFFSGAEVTINTGTRLLSPEERRHLDLLVGQQYGLRIKRVTCSEPEMATTPSVSSQETPPVMTAPTLQPQPQSVEDTAPPKQEEGTEAQTLDDVDVTYEGDDADFMKMLDETFRIPVKRNAEYQHPSSNDYLYENEESAFYFRGTVRSGQTLEFSGNIVILGDVNPGAYVVASGDIIVMGRLHGVVHAGAEGEERATVIGAHFQPSQLRIAQYIGRSPDEFPRSRQKQFQTEKAYIKDGVIVIEPIL